ncbi:MAG: DUF1858 domain-containing protein [Myxococcota bacterium]
MSTDARVARLVITPASKIGALLDAYPELEEVLFKTAPLFRKLKNPVLRRTVAQVATVERAAGVAGVPVRDLVQTLRQAVGQDEWLGETAVPLSTEESPRWLEEGKVVATFDADAMLARGEVPLGPVLRRARTLVAGELVRLNASFRPMPLLDQLERAGHPHHLKSAEGGFSLFVGHRARP